jgi:hypothetical protein
MRSAREPSRRASFPPTVPTAPCPFCGAFGRGSGVARPLFHRLRPSVTQRKRFAREGGRNMSSISCASYVCIRASRIRFSAPFVSGLRNVIQLFAVVWEQLHLRPALSRLLSPRTLICPARSKRSLQHTRRASFVTRVAVVRKHTPFASHKNGAEKQVASPGLASFYTEGTQTASVKGSIRTN